MAQGYAWAIFHEGRRGGYARHIQVEPIDTSGVRRSVHGARQIFQKKATAVKAARREFNRLGWIEKILVWNMSRGRFERLR
jgi:hypothetical protein